MSRAQNDLAADLFDTVADALAERLAPRLAELLRDSRRKTDQAPRYLGERAVAERLGLSVRTLQNWRVSHRGPKYCKAGTRVVYPVEGLDRWLQADGASRTSDTKADTSAVAPAKVDRRGRRGARAGQP